MPVRVQKDPFEPWALLQETEAGLGALHGKFGATAVFVGTSRDFNDGATVSTMTLEHYPGMTERHLQKIEAEARNRWPILEALVVHRYGVLPPGEPIVLVAVWSAHRDAAFAACRYLIDELKTRAPFWKLEATPGGGRWVEHQ